MAAIPGYERVVVRQGQVADTVNPGAIQNAASGWNAAANVLDTGAQVQLKIQEEDDKATLNEMIITREREKIDFVEAAKKNYEGRPDGFSTFVEKEMKKKDADTLAALPARLQQPYKQTTMRANLSDYESNKGWETDRKIAVVGDKISRAGKEISNLGYIYGASGKSFDELVPNIDATMVAGSGVLAPEKLSKFDEDLRSDAAKQYLAGLMTRDPQAAQDLLNSGKFTKYLTTEDSLKASKGIWEATPDLMKMEQIKNGKQPLSVRNNNPGNIRGEGGAFKKFATPEEGQKAMADDLRVKISGKSAAMKGKFGADYQPTLSNLLHTWAPTNENDTAAYIATVEKETGLKAGQVLTTADIPKLQQAMIKVEGGQSAANYFATGTAFDAMPYGEKLNEMEKISKTIADDPAKAAMQYGATTPQAIVQVQSGLGIKPQNAQVMTNQQAVEMATQINAVENSDEIFAAAKGLRESYGEYTFNAIADLKAKGKMKPAMEGALTLAASGNPAYKEHVELLAQVGKAGTDSVNGLFSTNGYNAKDLNAKIAEKTLDWQRASMMEGRSPEEIQEKLGVMTALAKAKMSKMLDGDYDSAVAFAALPENNSFKIAEVNGSQFRVPTSFSVDVVEDAVDESMTGKLREMVEGSKDKDYVFSNKASPFLNPDEDGVMFRTPMGEVVTDKDGKTIDFKFSELVAQYTAAKKAKPYVRAGFFGG